MVSRLLSLFIVSFLAGCAAIPESIQVPDNTPLVVYQQVAANPESTKNATVRWGGVIAEVENLPEQTKLEIVHYPLRSYGRPLVDDESVGRFRVYVDGFLDPMVYEQGRAITFTGTAAGIEEGAVGEHNYVFPTLKASGYHLWKDIQRVEVTTHIWPYHHWYGYYGYPMFPVHQRVIIKTSGNKSPVKNSSPSKASDASRGAENHRKSGNNGSLKEY